MIVKKTSLLLLLCASLFLSCAEPWEYSAPPEIQAPQNSVEPPVPEKPVNKDPVITPGIGSLTIDFQTTEAEDEKITCTFTASPTVSYAREGGSFLRIDGLLGTPAEMNETITELLTHYHTDHVTRSVVEQCLRDGSFMRLIAPYPALASSRERVFSLLSERAGIADPAAKQNDPVMEITPDGGVLIRVPSSIIGDFYYSSLALGEDIFIEMFKYHKPRDVNADGLIFLISHKNVSYLLFGDFDDPDGIDKLLDIFSAYRIKCDVIKWPHHAHKFPNNEKSNGIIRKMNEVLEPRFIIWQRYPTQNGFVEYITRFDFSDKFLCSDDMEIFIISFYFDEASVRPEFYDRILYGRILSGCIEHFFLFG